MKHVQVCKNGDSPSFHSRDTCQLCTEQAALLSLLMLTVKHFSGTESGTIQGRNPRVALRGAKSSPCRLLCSLLSPNQPLLGPKCLSQRSHTNISPLCSGRSQSLLGAGSQQAPEAQRESAQCPRRGWSSTTGMSGPPDTPRRGPGVILWTQLPAQHQQPLPGPLPAPCSSQRGSRSTRGTWHWLLSLQPRQC